MSSVQFPPFNGRGLYSGGEPSFCRQHWPASSSSAYDDVARALLGRARSRCQVWWKYEREIGDGSNHSQECQNYINFQPVDNVIRMCSPRSSPDTRHRSRLSGQHYTGCTCPHCPSSWSIVSIITVSSASVCPCPKCPVQSVQSVRLLRAGRQYCFSPAVTSHPNGPQRGKFLPTSRDTH